MQPRSCEEVARPWPFDVEETWGLKVSSAGNLLVLLLSSESLIAVLVSLSTSRNLLVALDIASISGMDDALNPYTPGSGIAPTVLTGRERDLHAFDNLVKRVQNGLLGRPMLLVGLRGVGKTVLLNQLKRKADQADWLTIKFEASQGARGREGARRALAQGLAKASLRYRTKAKVSEGFHFIAAAVKSFSLSVGQSIIDLGVEVGDIPPATGNLELDLHDVIEAITTTLLKEDKALGIFIDEMQDLDEELLEALISAQHEAGQLGLPFYIIGAGLPSLPGILAESRSYAERMFEVHQIGRLEMYAAVAAFREPARTQNVEFDDEAVEYLANVSGQYPYFIQEFGAQMWRTARTSPMDSDAARRAARLGIEQLDRGFFQARWDRATPAERDYLTAMAKVGGEEISSKDIADILGKDTKKLGPVRAKLISKGLIYAPEHGRVSYTVPNFDDFIARQNG